VEAALQYSLIGTAVMSSLFLIVGGLQNGRS